MIKEVDMNSTILQVQCLDKKWNFEPLFEHLLGSELKFGRGATCIL